MPAPLPANPDLDQLKRQAKTLRDLVRDGAERALDLVRAQHPRLGDLRAATPTAAGFKLADAQLTLARHLGFASWPRLRAYVEVVNDLARSPHLVEVRTDPADELLRLACLTYGGDDPVRPQAARALLSAQPSLARASLHTMAAVGDAEAARDLLAGDPAAADRAGGPFDWPPLLHATYSRIDLVGAGHDPVATVRVLLEAGADPAAGYLWEGLTSPFTALTGALGGGEGSQPPMRAWREVASLLLAAGADPNDSQGVYNRGPGDLARDDVDWLELLDAHGFGRGDGGVWHRRLAPHHPTPVDLVADVLQHAAQAGLVRRVGFLLERGADPNRRAQHPIYRGRTPYQSALRHGNVEVAGMLVAAGAVTVGVDDADRVVGLLLAGDAAARAADAGLLDAARQREPGLVIDAAELGRGAAVELLVGLGWDVDARRRSTALHEAALRGQADLVHRLLALGADPSIHDLEFDAPPSGWAHHAGHHELAVELEAAAARRG